MTTSIFPERRALSALLAALAASAASAQEGVSVQLDAPYRHTSPGHTLLIGRVTGQPPFQLTVNGEAVTVEVQEETNLWQLPVELGPGNFRVDMQVVDATGAVGRGRADVLALKDWPPNDPRPVVHVETVEELLIALRDRQVIALAEGDFLLDEPLRMSFAHAQQREGTRNLVLHDLEDVALIGSGNGPTRLVSRNPFGTALSFERCKSLTLAAVQLAHEPDPAEEARGEGGGALVLRNCERVWLRDCQLYGLGLGLKLVNCNSIGLIDSVVRDCTRGVLESRNSEILRFRRSRFLSCGRGREGDVGLVFEGRRRDTDFVDVEVRGNAPAPDTALFVLESRNDVMYFVDGVIAENRAARLRGGGARTLLKVLESEVQEF